LKVFSRSSKTFCEHLLNNITNLAFLQDLQEISRLFEKSVALKRPMFLARKKLISGIQRDANLAYRYVRDRYATELQNEERENEVVEILERNMSNLLATIVNEFDEEKRKKILDYVDKLIARDEGMAENSNARANKTFRLIFILFRAIF